MRSFAGSFVGGVVLLVTACGGAQAPAAGPSPLSASDERLANVYGAALPVLAAVEGGPKERVYVLTTTIPTEPDDQAGQINEEVRERAAQLSGLSVEWVSTAEEAYAADSPGLVRNGTSLLTLGTVGAGDDVLILGINYIGNVGSRSPLLRVRRDSDGAWEASIQNLGPVA